MLSRSGHKTEHSLHSRAILRIYGAVTPLPLTPPWHSTQTYKISPSHLFTSWWQDRLKAVGGSVYVEQILCWLHCFYFHSWYLSCSSKTSVDINPGGGIIHVTLLFKSPFPSLLITSLQQQGKRIECNFECKSLSAFGVVESVTTNKSTETTTTKTSTTAIPSRWLNHAFDFITKRVSEVHISSINFKF